MPFLAGGNGDSEVGWLEMTFLELDPTLLKMAIYTKRNGWCTADARAAARAAARARDLVRAFVRCPFVRSLFLRSFFRRISFGRSFIPSFGSVVCSFRPLLLSSRGAVLRLLALVVQTTNAAVK
jgi:hypothetical protein